MTLSHQRPLGVWGFGWLPLVKVQNRHFEKVIACMVLKLTVYIKNVISFFYKLKALWNADIWNFFGEMFDFGLYFPENWLFGGSDMVMTSLWRHMLNVCILVCMERRDRFCEILARNYAPGAAAPGTVAPGAAAPGEWIIWDNFLSSICSRSIVWMYTAPGAYLDMLLEHCGFQICSWSIFAVCSWSIVHFNMLLEHIWLRILLQIIHAPGAAAPGA